MPEEGFGAFGFSMTFLINVLTFGPFCYVWSLQILITSHVYQKKKEKKISLPVF